MNKIKNIFATAQALLSKGNAPVQQGSCQVTSGLDAPQTPSPIPSIGKDNQVMMDSLTRAKKVAVMLGRLGHRVLDISIGGRNARLTIGSTSRCHMLGGVMIKVTRTSGVEEKTMATSIDGVQVEWTTASKQHEARK